MTKLKLFIHDKKHDRVIGEMEISNKTEILEAIEDIVNFLNENLTSRYNRLVVAKSYTSTYDKENDYSEVEFEY